MTTLIPGDGQPFTSVTRYVASADIYQTEARLPVMSVAPGRHRRGHDAALRRRQGMGNDPQLPERRRHRPVHRLDRLGLVLLPDQADVLAVAQSQRADREHGPGHHRADLIVKAVLFPLAYKSYASMARMRELQPEMEKIKERAGDDRQKMQQLMMELYKKEKVNPASGCLPILLQIPIFFSLYKVIFVTLELRHAPFFGWLNDLSAPDPSSIINLFGLLPIEAPDPNSILSLIFIGILPILLGISMWLQQKLNPQPTDPTQAAIFAWLPWVFMFMLGGFASGLLIYWIANNTLTFTQQYIIMKRHGYTPDLFGNIRASFQRKKPDAE
jgi:YidC/Oxa1 family membrane protein insertase